MLKIVRYDTIQHDVVYLTCSKKLIVKGVQESRWESRSINLRWKGFVKKVGFELGVKE